MGARIEILAIALALGLIWILPLPDRLDLGYLVLVLAVVFLLQSLVRDICLLVAMRRGRLVIPVQEKPAFCLESILGVTAVLAGIYLALSHSHGSVEMGSLRWILALGLTMIAGFLLRDTVVQWRPFSVYRDPGHLNYIVVRK